MATLLRFRWIFLALAVGLIGAMAPVEAEAKRQKRQKTFCSRANIDAYREQNSFSINKASGERFKKVVDLEAFYRHARKNKTLRRYAQSQEPYEGTDAILNLWNEKYHLNDHRPLAYILASVWHETGRKMHPVRETFAKTDAQAVARLNNCCRNRKGFAYYWFTVKETGHAYFGRGHIQLTWAANYKKADRFLGWSKEEGTSIYWEPKFALDSDRSAEITFDGMMYGWYSPGHCLPGFFKPNRAPNWNGARDIVNADYGKNGARIGNYAKAFNAVLDSPGVITTAAALKKKQEAAEEIAKEEAKQDKLAVLPPEEKKAVIEAEKKAEEEAKKEEDRKQKAAEQKEIAAQARQVEQERRRDDARRRVQKIERDVLALNQRLEKLDAAEADGTAKIEAEIKRVESEQSSLISLQGESIERMSDEIAKLRDDASLTQASLQRMEAKLDQLLGARDAKVDSLERKVKALEQCGFWDSLFGCETGE